uniref:Nonstructural protein n=1 Tax=Dulem virus 139 TaxID=3145616 RepID=A0AAU8B2K7_9VIRU
MKMNFKVYSIRDVKTGFMSPTFEINDAVAMRNFEHAVQNSGTVLFTHAGDFSLFCIGTFDSDSGRLMPLELPIEIMSGASCVK